MAGKKGSGCGGPIGNQHAKGCTTSGAKKFYTKEVVLKIAEDLLEWSKQPDALKLTMFSAPRQIHSARITEWADEYDEFAEFLDIAKQNIDINRFRASCQDLMPSEFYRRSEAMYDGYIHRYERGEKMFESSLRKSEEEQKQSTYNIMVPHDLAVGANIPASKISVKSNKGSK